MGPLSSRLWGFSPLHFPLARSWQDKPPSRCSTCFDGSLQGTWDVQVPSLLLLLTLQGNFLPAVVLSGWQPAAGQGLCRRQASPTASRLVVEQELISQKPCMISPGDCWCVKPSTQIFIWLTVSKMLVHLRNVFSFFFFFFFS